MANKIILKKSSVASKVPSSSDLEVGELAVNLADQKLYSKNAAGSVIQLGGGSGSGDVVGPSSAVDNSIARFDSTTGKIIQGSQASIDDAGNLTATSFNGSGSGLTGTATSLSIGGNAATATTATSATTATTATTASSANKWSSARTLSFSGDVTGSNTVDGSTNVATALTLANTTVTAGSYTNASITVDAKGRLTAASSGAAPLAATFPFYKSSGVFDAIGILTGNYLPFYNSSGASKNIALTT